MHTSIQEIFLESLGSMMIMVTKMILMNNKIRDILLDIVYPVLNVFSNIYYNREYK